MKPEVKVFTKDHPCTKADIWRCFRTATGFKPVQVDIAHSQIGKNVPRVMERNGYLVKTLGVSADHYVLTDDGEQWLIRGIESYMKNHPAERDSIPYLGAPRQRRVRMRS